MIIADQDADDRKAKIDQHKDEQLKGQKEGKGQWKGELGSNSESAVRGTLLQAFLGAVGLDRLWDMV